VYAGSIPTPASKFGTIGRFQALLAWRKRCAARRSHVRRHFKHAFIHTMCAYASFQRGSRCMFAPDRAPEWSYFITAHPADCPCTDCFCEADAARGPRRWRSGSAFEGCDRLLRVVTRLSCTPVQFPTPASNQHQTSSRFSRSQRSSRVWNILRTKMSLSVNS